MTPPGNLHSGIKNTWKGSYCLFLYDENNKEETEAQRDLLFLWHLDAAMFKPGLNKRLSSWQVFRQKTSRRTYWLFIPWKRRYQLNPHRTCSLRLWKVSRKFQSEGGLAAIMELTDNRACRDTKPEGSKTWSDGGAEIVPSGGDPCCFSLSVLSSCVPRCDCSHQKCTAEQVTKASNFWPKDWKRRVQRIGNNQGYHGGIHLIRALRCKMNFHPRHTRVQHPLPLKWICCCLERTVKRCDCLVEQQNQNMQWRFLHQGKREADLEGTLQSISYSKW